MPETYLSHTERRSLLHNLSVTNNDFRSPQMAANFRQEINLARAELKLPDVLRKSSLSYIETPAELIKSPELCDLVVSIGGSNLIISSKGRIIENKEIGIIKDGIAFLDQLANILSKFDSKSISIDFAFPVKIVTNAFDGADGTMIGQGSKGHDLSNLQDLNTPIGEYLTRKMDKVNYVQLANDTVLGLALVRAQGKDGLVIVGTGFNMAIYKDGQLVNLEAGAYNRFKIPNSLQRLNPNISLPINHPLEMTIAGCGIDPQYNFLKGKGQKLNTKQIFELAGTFDINVAPTKIKTNKDLAQALISNARQGVIAIENGARQYIGSDIKFGYIGSVVESMNNLAR
jgi:hypothetical protein